MRVVIDTNCLLASIPPKGAYYWLYEAFEQERFEWDISNEILTEYDEKISERYSSRTAHLVLTVLTFAYLYNKFVPHFCSIYPNILGHLFGN
jgi:predicted nucleic acid-binding protein